jgi:hypothetical protein
MKLHNMSFLKKAILFSAFILFIVFNFSQSQENKDILNSTLGSNIQLSNNEKYVYNNITNVNITKIVDGRKGHIEYTYKINVSKVDDFEFILALDSSGSFGDGGDISQANAVRGAIPEFIRKIPERHSDKNFNLSIISWDDGIDFAYPAKRSLDPFRNNETNGVELINVSRVQEDLNKYEPFSKSNNRLYYAREEEITDLSIPIRSSLDIFNRIKVNEYNRTSRFIILVTGRGEYVPFDQKLINRAKELNCSIYVIGMDLLDSSTNMSRQLRQLADNDPKKFQPLPYAAEAASLERDLLEALQIALDNAVKEPAAMNCTIVESLYEYANPNENYISVIERPRNGGEAIYPRYRFYENLENGNRTRKVMIELLDGLLPESETTITLSVDLQLKKFPLSFSAESMNFFKDMAKINGKPDQHVNYTWLKRLSINDELPDIPVDIDIIS